jgi:hypothetical protein
MEDGMLDGVSLRFTESDDVSSSMQACARLCLLCLMMVLRMMIEDATIPETQPVSVARVRDETVFGAATSSG